MKVNRHFDLILYGVLLGALGVVAHRAAPDRGEMVLITGIAGGALVLLWGALGLVGRCRRAYPLGTLILLNSALLAEGVRVWREVVDGADALRPMALIVTVLLGAGICELTHFLPAGAADDDTGSNSARPHGAE